MPASRLTRGTIASRGFLASRRFHAAAGAERTGNSARTGRRALASHFVPQAGNRATKPLGTFRRSRKRARLRRPRGFERAAAAAAERPCDNWTRAAFERRAASLVASVARRATWHDEADALPALAGNRGAIGGLFVVVANASASAGRGWFSAAAAGRNERATTATLACSWSSPRQENEDPVWTPGYAHATFFDEADAPALHFVPPFRRWPGTGEQP